MWVELCLIFLGLILRTCETADPVFDPAARMRMVLVPADAAVGSVIYRLRASDADFDYPLNFELLEGSSSSLVSVETLACTKYNSVCQANVVLRRRLEAGRYYDFRVKVQDTRGGTNTLECAISATNGTTPMHDTFLNAPGLLMIPEDAKRGTELGFVVARKNPLSQKPVYLELWGSPLFAIRQRQLTPDTTEGTIFLLGPLDFETQSMYRLTLLANDAFPNPRYDSRNIFELNVVVAVEDVQDSPPVFREAPPITTIPSTLLPGDIVSKVHAEDGDRGAPRALSYGLVSEGNPFTPFFAINETTGDIILLRPLDEIAAISHAGSPILLTVIAEEVKVSRDEPPSQASTVQLAFIMPDRANNPPYFDSDSYIARIDENSPQGATLIFPESPATRVRDDDPGDKGVFSLNLAGNNGTFEILPSVGDRDATFYIRVRDNRLLDFEVETFVQFQIIAQELGPTSNLSATTNVTVYINDVNDNPPSFLKDEYIAEITENATMGTIVTQVSARDIDTGNGGKVHYTQILGYKNTSLVLDPITGVITVGSNNHGLDCEEMPEYHFLVEARDNEGTGNRMTVPLVIQLIDVNDETPRFERDIYEFMLSPGLNNFTVPAFIKAIDNDARAPNNVIRYELIHGNYDNKFLLDEITGELTVRESSTRNRRNKRETPKNSPAGMEVYAMTARAYDLGVPHRASVTSLRVYPPESRSRTVAFIVPGTNPDRKLTQEKIATLTGADVTIQDIRPYKENKDKSIALVILEYDSNTVIDVETIQRRLSANYSAAVVTEDPIKESKAGGSYIWLLIFLALLIAAIIVALILCCICEGCPLYIAPRKSIITSDDGVRLVVHEVSEKPVAKNIERRKPREAWSADADPRTEPTQWQFNRRNNYNMASNTAHVRLRSDDLGDTPPEHIRGIKDKIQTAHETRSQPALRLRDGPHIIYTRDVQQRMSHLDLQREREKHLQTMRIEDVEQQRQMYEAEHETESMRRHEIDRGSAQPTSRDQLFIREGNTEILQLLTRGRDEPQTQYVVLDNGKDILMRKFIEEQQQRQSVPAWNQNVQPEVAVAYQAEVANQIQQTATSLRQEILEESLKQQNALLRQILLEKERLQQSKYDGLLETQSLPGHSVIPTQTDNNPNAGTQTDPRRTRSDRDDSPSDDEYWERKRRIKRKKQRHRDKIIKFIEVQRKIRTPIEEEPEVDWENVHRQRLTRNENENESDKRKITVLRRKKDFVDIRDVRSAASLKQDVLMEISDSLDEDLKENVFIKKSKAASEQIVELKPAPNHEEKFYDIKKGKQNNSSSTEEEEEEHFIVEEDEKGRYKIRAISQESLLDANENNQKRILVRSTGVQKPPSIKHKSSSSEGSHRDSKVPVQISRHASPVKPDSSKKRHPSSEQKPKGPAPKPPTVESIQEEADSTKFDESKSVPRYMQWYFQKNGEAKQPRKTESRTEVKAKPSANKTKAKKKVSVTSSSAESGSGTQDQKSGGKSEKQPQILKQDLETSQNVGKDMEVKHSLTQHSEYRYEHPSTTLETKNEVTKPQEKLEPKVGEDDEDSGIAMTSMILKNLSSSTKRNPMAEKKSVFTIAYDDVRIKKIRSDSTTPPY